MNGILCFLHYAFYNCPMYAESRRAPHDQGPSLNKTSLSHLLGRLNETLVTCGNDEIFHNRGLINCSVLIR